MGLEVPGMWAFVSSRRFQSGQETRSLHHQTSVAALTSCQLCLVTTYVCLPRLICWVFFPALFAHRRDFRFISCLLLCPDLQPLFYLLKAYSPINHTGSPQGFSQVQILH